MPDPDTSPRAARRLRTFGRRRAPEFDAPFVAGLTPDSTTDPLSTPPPEPEPDTRRRWRSRADDDAISIGGDDDHAWWAQREDLQRAVDPRKQAAAARARRAARQAFAPEGARARRDPVAEPPPVADEPRGRWDPSDVYTWSAPDEPVGEPPSCDEPAVTAGATPWDVLGLTSEASWPEVTRRHRQLAKQHHPDLHSGGDQAERHSAEQKMSEINAAFSDLRRIYRLTDGA